MTKLSVTMTLIMLCLGACSADHERAGHDETVASGRTLATSANHSCAIRQAGLYCWGENVRGALGDGSSDDSPSAVRAVAAGDDVVEVGTSSARTCVRRGSGEIACWGANEHGQIGDGTRDDARLAVAAKGITDARGLAVDDNSTCAIHGAMRGVSCWGESSTLSPTSGTLVPAAISGVSNAVELRVGSLGTYCARDAAGAVFCWRFVDGAWTAAQRVTGLTDARAISLPSEDVVCAISAAPRVTCHNFVRDFAVELPDSEDALRMGDATGLSACAETPAGWRCWNVPSFVWDLMGATDVAGLFAIEIVTDVPLREVAIAGLRACVLREDQSVACASADELTLDAMRAKVMGKVDALPL